MALLLGISLLLFVPGYGGELTTRLVQQVLETAPAAMVPINTGVSLAQLLPQTYNKLMLPQAKPTKVYVNLQILNLYEISDLDGVARLDILLDIRWKDERLVNLVPRLQRVDIEKIWTPALSLSNMRLVPRQVQSNAELQPDGTVRSVRRWNTEISVFFDMTHFPFDHHYIPVELDSFAYDAEQVILIPWAGSYNTSNQLGARLVRHDISRLKSNIWNLHNWVTKATIHPSLMSPRDSYIQGHLSLSRKSSMIVFEVRLLLCRQCIGSGSGPYIGGVLEQLQLYLWMLCVCVILVVLRGCSRAHPCTPSQFTICVWSCLAIALSSMPGRGVGCTHPWRKVVFPLFILVMFSFSAFFVRLESIDVRAAITSIALLAVSEVP